METLGKKLALEGKTLGKKLAINGKTLGTKGKTKEDRNAYMENMKSCTINDNISNINCIHRI